jgi:hypothetical protein
MRPATNGDTHPAGGRSAPAPAPLTVQVDAEALAPLVRVTVAEVLAMLQADRDPFAGKLALPEKEVAALLSLEQYQLRDERRRGRIEASVGPGRTILYTREQVLAYLASRRWEPKEKD